MLGQTLTGSSPITRDELVSLFTSGFAFSLLNNSTNRVRYRVHSTRMTWNSTWVHISLLHLCPLPFSLKRQLALYLTLLNESLPKHHRLFLRLCPGHPQDVLSQFPHLIRLPFSRRGLRDQPFLFSLKHDMIPPAPTWLIPITAPSPHLYRFLKRLQRRRATGQKLHTVVSPIESGTTQVPTRPPTPQQRGVSRRHHTECKP
jgi:hypothetical protein